MIAVCCCVDYRNSLLASSYVCLMLFRETSHFCSSALTISLCFLEMSRKAFPTDLLTYSLSSSFKWLRNRTAVPGWSQKYGLPVQILNPSVTARRTFGFESASHSLMTGSACSYPRSAQYLSKAFARISCTRQSLSLLTCILRYLRLFSDLAASLPNMNVARLRA